jgi:hypothetical protein
MLRLHKLALCDIFQQNRLHWKIVVEISGCFLYSQGMEAEEPARNSTFPLRCENTLFWLVPFRGGATNLE